MPALPTPAQALQRWQAGVAGAGPRYTAGVSASNDWAGPLVAAESAMAANFNQAISSGKFSNAVQQLTTAGWQRKTVAKAGNWQTGVNTPTAAQNYQAGYQRLAGFIQTAQAAIASMPRGGYQENKARLNAYIDSMHASKLAAG